MRLGLILSLTIAQFVASVANAKPRGLAREKPSQLEEVLTAAGWTMTPERSSTYTVGDIYDRRTNTPVAFRVDCFEAEPREGVYTSYEVVHAMKAGAKIPLGVSNFKAEGMRFKKLQFAEPYMTELADMHLVPNDTCTTFLRSLDSGLKDLFVIKAVLSAEVKEQICSTLDTSTGIRGLGGASASSQQQCEQASEGHVAVAYKTKPIEDLLKRRAAMGVAEVNRGGDTASVKIPGPSTAPGPMVSSGNQNDSVKLGEVESSVLEVGTFSKDFKLVLTLTEPDGSERHFTPTSGRQVNAFQGPASWRVKGPFSDEEISFDFNMKPPSTALPLPSGALLSIDDQVAYQHLYRPNEALLEHYTVAVPGAKAHSFTVVPSPVVPGKFTHTRLSSSAVPALVAHSRWMNDRRQSMRYAAGAGLSATLSVSAVVLNQSYKSKAAGSLGEAALLTGATESDEVDRLNALAQSQTTTANTYMIGAISAAVVSAGLGYLFYNKKKKAKASQKHFDEARLQPYTMENK
jgi:hypothetical protein